MSIEYFTGFEGCNTTAEAQLFISNPYSTSVPSFLATGGYDNGKCIKINTNSHSFGVSCSAAKTKVTGFHVIDVGVYESPRYERFLVKFYGPDIYLCNAEAGIKVYHDSTYLGILGTSCIGTSCTHFEAKVFSDASVGTVEVKINGTSIGSLTGIDTGGEDITRIVIGNTDAISSKLDNWFIADDWQGVLISMLCSPTSDSSVQFTPSEGTDNYALVDDVESDGDTTYVESGTIGQKDLYGYGDVPTGYLVKAVTLVTTARKDDSGTRTLSIIAKQDSTEYEQEEYTLPEAYPTYSGGSITTLGVCPDATEWDRTKFNSIEWGFEVAS